MLHIIITVDYEIFGNGRGDPKRHIVKPMQKILDVADRFEVPITIMFEACEYNTFKKYDEELRKRLRYSPVEIIKEQISEAYSAGHDVQLHIHPQFVNMKYENKRFVIEDPKRRIEDFSTDEVREILKKGIMAVREVTGDSTKKVEVLRLSNMPWDEAPHKILSVMEELGFKAHSLALSTNKKNTEKNIWRINNSSILEVPILTYPVSKINYYTARRIFTIVYLRLYTTLKITQNDSSLDKHKMPLAKFDLSKLTYKQMIDFVERATTDYNYEKYDIPLVMIGHTKDFFNERNFECFLKEVKKNYVSVGIAKFSTFNDFLRELGGEENGG